MLDRIAQLEKEAQALEPTPQQRREVRNKVIDYTESFLNNINDLHAFNWHKDKNDALFKDPFPGPPQDIKEVLDQLKNNVDIPGLNPASGGHLGYIPGGGIYYSSLGDYLAAISNRYAGVFFASPGAVRMENSIIDWMAEIVGYPNTAAGNLTSGGSIANLIGIVTARDASGLKAKDFHRSVIYLTQQVHHSAGKAIRIAGLGESVTRNIPLDSRYRMNANALEQTIKKDKKKGLIPFLVISSAGTTDTGAVDPVARIGEVSDKHNMWHHIDGAYGAFFILCEEGRKIIKGLDKSDSVVMDPHKGLFLPYGSGALIVRDRSALQKSHYYQANYMQDAKEEGAELSPADLSPELTKHFRGLRLWLPLKLLGIKPFRAALEEKILLARYFYEKINEIPGFETGPYPDLSVVTYRYIPKSGDADEFNKRLIKEVQKDGKVFISSTLIDGKFTLRLAVLAFRTHLHTIDTLLEVLREKVEKIERS